MSTITSLQAARIAALEQGEDKHHFYLLSVPSVQGVVTDIEH